jgi:hypothetical protein
MSRGGGGSADHPHDNQGWWGTTRADGGGELGGTEGVLSGTIGVMGSGGGLRAATSPNLARTTPSVAQGRRI